MTVYYNPEDYGLVTVGEISLDDEPWQFDLIAVWRNPETGVLYWAQDAGCSCPSPFENLTADDLTSGSIHDLQAEVQDYLDGDNGDWIMGQFIDIAMRVRSYSSPTAISDMVDEGLLTHEQASERVLNLASGD